MPKPLPRVPHVESPFLLRAELLTVVPHSMATVDRLEAEGKFPKRIRLEPTNRVAWLRREVTAYLRHLANRRRPPAQEDHVKAADHRFVGRPNRSGPTSKDKAANPPLKLLAELATTDTGFKAPPPREASSARHVGFDPIPDQLFCKCGVELSHFSFRRHYNTSALISCRACHAELAQINFNMER
jgi:predicted DNA-binding transcriptional regulator AlpA